jgi:hypothetical protein
MVNKMACGRLAPSTLVSLANFHSTDCSTFNATQDYYNRSKSDQHTSALGLTRFEEIVVTKRRKLPWAMKIHFGRLLADEFGKLTLGLHYEDPHTMKYAVLC